MHRSHVLPQQQLVTLTLMLGMLESCMDYTDTSRLNATGRPNYALKGGGIVVSAAYKSSLWLTVLLLARGFGFLRSTGNGRYPLLLGTTPASIVSVEQLRFLTCYMHGWVPYNHTVHSLRADVAECSNGVLLCGQCGELSEAA